MINSCYKKISLKESLDPNFVKVILNTENHAIYFSRSQIPFNANNKSIEYYGHLGIYGFSKISLNNFCNLKPCLLENIEKL